MDNFDKYFSDKLNESHSFQHQEQNWQHLSQRLDAFEYGHQLLRQSANAWRLAAISLLAFCVILVWKQVNTEKFQKSQTEQLQQQQEQLLQLTNAVAMLSKQQRGEAQLRNEDQAMGVKNMPTQPLSPVIYRRSEAENTGLVASAPRKQALLNTEIPKPIPAITRSDLSPQTIGEAAPEIKAGVGAAQKNTSLVDTISINMRETLAMIDTNAILLKPEIESGMVVESPPIVPSNEVAVSNQESLKDSVTVASLPMIKPVKTKLRGFSLGLQAKIGQNQQFDDETSAITGLGVSLHYTLVKGLTVFGSAEVLSYNIDSHKEIPGFRWRDTTSQMPHGHHQDELKQIESRRAQRQFALGLSYTLPLGRSLHPAIRVAHRWSYEPERLVSFKYDNHHGGGGPGPNPGSSGDQYFTSKIGRQSQSNLWSAGIGIEKDLPRWRLGLWLDVKDDFNAAKSLVNGAFVSVNAQYKI